MYVFYFQIFKCIQVDIRLQWDKSVLRQSGINQSASEGVQALSVATKLPAIQQFYINLASLLQRQQYCLGVAVF